MKYSDIKSHKKSISEDDAGSGSSWDGVNPSTQQVVNEKDSYSHVDVIKDFILFCKKSLKIKKLPKVKLKRDAEWSSENKTFGHYNPNDNSLVVNLAGRNICDILRTVGHELVHCKQFESVDMPMDAGDTGSPAENHANSVAGILMREYGKMHPELFQMPVLSEQFSVRELKNRDQLREFLTHRAKQIQSLVSEQSNATAIHKKFIDMIRENTDDDEYANWLVDLVQESTFHGNLKVGDRISTAFLDVIRHAKEAYFFGTAEPQAITKFVHNANGTLNYLMLENGDRFPRVEQASYNGNHLQHMLITKNKDELLSTVMWAQLKKPNDWLLEVELNSQTPLNEASGYIPTKAEAHDPRFEMALSCDVHPGTLGKVANAFDLDTDSQGRPQIANPNGKVSRLSESLMKELQEFKTTLTPNDINKLTFESFDDYRRWCQAPKTNSHRNPMFHPNRYQGIFIDDTNLRESNDEFAKRKQQAKEFSNEFLSYDDRDNVVLKIGNKISVLSCIVAPSDNISRIELSGSISPREIANLVLSSDDKIDTIEFTDGTQYPEKAQETVVDNINLVNTIFFQDQAKAKYAMTSIELLLWGMEGKGWSIERYMSESSEIVDESISMTGEYNKVLNVVKRSMTESVEEFVSNFRTLNENNLKPSIHWMQQILEQKLSKNFLEDFNTNVRFEEMKYGGYYDNAGNIALSFDIVKRLAEAMVKSLLDWSPEPGSYDDEGDLIIDISDFNEYNELAQDVYQTRPHAVKELVEIFIHEYVHREQHKRIGHKNATKGTTLPNQYRSYLQRNKELFAKAIQNLDSDEDWRAYLSSPQEITSHAHDLANRLIQGALFGEQLEDIGPDAAEWAIKSLKNTLKDASNYQSQPKYTQFNVFDKDNAKHKKIVNRFLKTVYQEVAAAIQTLQSKVQSGNLSESLSSPYSLTQGLNTDSIVSYKWQDDEGAKGSIGFVRGGHDQDWEITFNVGGKFDITNKGDAFRTFATAKDAIKQFMMTPQGKGAERVYFSAKTTEPSRVKLYDKLAQMMEKNGFKLHHTEVDGLQKFYYFKNPTYSEEELVAEAQTVKKLMPDIKLWKVRVKIKQPNYIGYVEAQVTAPDMRTARNMLKALYNASESEVGSVTLVKQKY